MEIIAKDFASLSCDELYEILRLRAEIFVVEQECVYQDLDGIDRFAYHVYAKEGNEMLGCLRVINKGDRLEEVSIGRVVSKKRRCGVGRKMMEKGFEIAKEKFNASCVVVGAQVRAKAFYESVGFFQISDEYLEDGIEHIYMKRELPN